MKKILLPIGFICTICLTSCVEAPAHQEVNRTPLYDTHLMDQVSPGLHLISINDSTQVLIYRGVESCTMIQLK
jgi:hypothetical protein